MAAGERIKVAHLLTKPELGGAQANTLYTVRHLDRTRFYPSLVTSPDGELAGDMACIQDAQVAFVPDLVREIRPLRDGRAACELVKVIRSIGPRIVHTHSSKAGILGRWAARRAGVPLVIHTVHGFPFHDHQRLARKTFYVALERMASRLTDRFVCVSRADMTKGEAYHVFDSERVELIRSGISLEDYRRAAGTGMGLRGELGIPRTAPLAGMVACFKPQKDPLTFVRAAAQVARRVSAARFLMVGDGELRGAVQRVRAEEGLGDRLVVTGWRRDIPRVMDALNVCVLTSLHEGLPRVVPEAMACARPVVATAVDGTPEAVSEGRTGYLVPPGDIQRTAARVSELLLDPDRARRMGEEAARRVGEFDIDRMVQRQEQMYLDLMARHGINA